jgi:hypothetical protein
MNKIKRDNSKIELADEMKHAYDSVSPFIEKHTAVVCPECEKVCCIDKHGRYDKDDIIFVKILGIKIPDNISVRKETDPCRFLKKTGCSLERWKRPYRCTFFFCDPLLKSIENDNAKLYRAFLEYFQYLISARQKFLDKKREP